MRRIGPLLVVLALLLTAAPAAAETFTVTTLDDSTGECNGSNCPSIRRALAAAEGNDGADTIVIPAGEYQLSLGALTVDSPVTIRGGGARATRVFVGPQFPDRVFDITAATEISHLTMAGGTASSANGFFGGNIRNSGGTVLLDHVRVTGGSGESGGGISNNTGTMTIQHSLIDNNQALSGGGDGGGIQNFGTADVAGVLTVRDSTIAFNRANLAGGLFAWGSANLVTRLERVTVARNEGGFRGTGGIGYGDVGQTFTVSASIIAGNTVDGVASNCGQQIPASSGANVVSNSDCGFAAAGDVQDADPQLSAVLTDTGGATDVLPIAATSPAVDRAGACTGADQRDLPRPQGSACDAGAYELQQSPPPAPPAASQQEPEPEFHETVVVEEVSGTVRVRLKGSNRFVSIDEAQGIPLGSTIDTKKGVVELASQPKEGAEPQTARFYAGIFRVTQPGSVTDLELTEQLAPCTARGAIAAAKRKPKKRKLWGDGKGKFRTDGEFSSATVRGTKWLVQDTCAGTLTRVARGVVNVRDRVKRKTIRLRAGKRYLARPKP